MTRTPLGPIVVVLLVAGLVAALATVGAVSALNSSFATVTFWIAVACLGASAALIVLRYRRS